MQKLILPFKKQMMLCGFKSASYKAHWKYDHYGLDVSTIQGGAGTDAKIYGSGNGTVMLAGYDNCVGNTVIVVYDDVYIHATGEIKSLTARYAHLASTNVKAGDKVTVDTILGVEGNTPTSAGWDYHLHIEFDTDTKYYQYSPQVSSWDDNKTQAEGNMWIKGTDSCLDPNLIWYQTADRVTVTPTYNPSWLNSTDFDIPMLVESTDTGSSDTNVEKLTAELEEAMNALKQAEETIAMIKDLVDGV